MLKKLLVLILSLSLLIIGFTGCGNDNSNNNKISIAVVGDKVERNIIKTLSDAFLEKEENKDVEIELVDINSAYDTFVVNNIYTKTLPEIISVYDFSAEYWTFANLLRPISDLMTRDGIDESLYFESAMSMARSGSDNQYYWFPRDYNKVVVCYNTAIFEFCGIEKPSDDWTMSDFKEVCRQLKEKTNEIKAEFNIRKFWPVEMELNWQAVYYPYIKSYGGDLFDFENGTTFKNLDKVKKAVNVLLEYADEPNDDYPGLGYAFPPDNNAKAFANGQSAMIFTSRPNVQRYAPNVDNKVDFVSMPTIEDRETEVSYIGMGCTGYGITSNCPEEKLEIAWRFLKYVISEEGQEVFGATGSGVPVIKSLANEKSSAWMNYISSDLNHEAFIKFPERDLAMNYMKGFKVSKQLAILKALEGKFLKDIYEEDDRDSFYEFFKLDLDSKIK